MFCCKKSYQLWGNTISISRVNTRIERALCLCQFSMLLSRIKYIGWEHGKKYMERMYIMFIYIWCILVTLKANCSFSFFVLCTLYCACGWYWSDMMKHNKWMPYIYIQYIFLVHDFESREQKKLYVQINMRSYYRKTCLWAKLFSSKYTDRTKC